ncbi:MAG: hypothetical protein NTV55_10225 [Planctomycetota bacterium]|nr:hypothetical protein [Planctomycetota bacterium]
MLTATAKRVNGFPGIHLACLVLVPLPGLWLGGLADRMSCSGQSFPCQSGRVAASPRNNARLAIAAASPGKTVAACD